MTAFLLTDTREIDIEITGVLDGDIHDLAALTPASDGRAEGLREAAEIVEQMMGEWAAATYQNPEARMQNAAKTYAAGDIMNAILARAAEIEGKADGQA